MSFLRHLMSWFRSARAQAPAARSRRAALRLEMFEQRAVPSATPILASLTALDVVEPAAEVRETSTDCGGVQATLACSNNLSPTESLAGGTDVAVPDPDGDGDDPGPPIPPSPLDEAARARTEPGAAGGGLP
jgi:hypothetical protein